MDRKISSCQILWKSLWENTCERCENDAKKLVGNGIFVCSGCSVLWKSVRFCGNLFGFSQKSVKICGESYLRRFGVDFIKFMFSTYPIMTTTNLYINKGRRN